MKKNEKLHSIFNSVSFMDQPEKRENLTADDICEALDDFLAGDKRAWN